MLIWRFPSEETLTELPEGAPSHSADAELPVFSAAAMAACMRPATGRFGGCQEDIGKPLQRVTVSLWEVFSQEKATVLL